MRMSKNRLHSSQTIALANLRLQIYLIEYFVNAGTLRLTTVLEPLLPEVQPQSEMSTRGDR